MKIIVFDYIGGAKRMGTSEIKLKRLRKGHWLDIDIFIAEHYVLVLHSMIRIHTKYYVIRHSRLYIYYT